MIDSFELERDAGGKPVPTFPHPDVVTRIARRDAAMAVVTRDVRRPRAKDVIGVISKEHIADSVAESIRPYGQ